MRPLIVRFGGMGDMVMATGLMKRIQKRYGMAPDVLTSGQWSRPLLTGRRFVNQVHTLRSRKFPFLFSYEQRRLVERLRKTVPRPVYLWDITPKTAWLLEKAGMDGRQVCDLNSIPWREREHTVSVLNRFANETPVFLDSSPPELEVPDELDVSLSVSTEAREDCRQWLDHKGLTGQPIVLFQPGNKKTMKGRNIRRKSNIKFWSPEDWGAVADAINQTFPEAWCLVCGVPGETDFAESILSHCKCTSKLMVVTNELPSNRLMALQTFAHSMISVDTGPAHAAAAVGCPLVVVFEKSDPALFRPVSGNSPVYLATPGLTSPEDWQPGTVTAGEVIETWKNLARSLDAHRQCLLQSRRHLAEARGNGAPSTPG